MSNFFHNKNQMIKITIPFFILLAFFTSCNETGKEATDETPTRGNLKVGIDDSYKLLGDAEIAVFESEYKHANVTPIYKPELEILDDFMKDSIHLIITGRQLTNDETAYLKSKNIYPKTTQLAFDAIAFITNKSNPDSLINYNEIRDIFLGKITKWSDMKPESKIGDIKVVFDNKKSGNVTYISNKLNFTKFPKNCSAVENSQAVVEYVEKHPNAIGIISVNWISDKEDSTSNSFLKNITVLAVSNEIEPDGPDYYRPYAAFVADKSYPFIREVYSIRSETYTGLGAGFSAFIAGEKGQRIILKSGMVPAVMPVRLVEIKKEF
jgi:phosphate transport system substrate-binding protein